MEFYTTIDFGNKDYAKIWLGVKQNQLVITENTNKNIKVGDQFTQNNINDIGNQVVLKFNSSEDVNRLIKYLEEVKANLILVEAC
jgi:hypothetical protein